MEPQNKEIINNKNEININDNEKNNKNNNEKVTRKNNNKKKSKINKKIIEQSNLNNKNENEEKVKKIENKNHIIKVKIVDELPKDAVLENKIKNTIYKIIFVFHNQDNFISVKPELKMINLIKKIGKKLDISIEKLSFNYKDFEITDKYNDMTVKEFFNFPINKSRPIIYVKIKQNYNNNSQNNLNGENEKYSLFYKKNYDNKVKIMNYPSMMDINIGANDDIYNIINTFLKESNIVSDFTCERNEEAKDNKIKVPNDNNDSNNNDLISNINSDNNTNLLENKSESNINNNNDNNKSIVYYIGFPSPDIAFDFNRYMNSLRLMNPTFKNIKTIFISSKKKSPKKIKLNDDQNIYSRRVYKNNYNYRYGTSLNLEERDLDKRNIEILNIVRNNYLNNKMKGLIRGSNSYNNYLSISSPYSTPYDERIKDNHENKKKWLNSRGFISTVNKYSGVHI